jgi:hypothetical protein
MPDVVAAVVEAVHNRAEGGAVVALATVRRHRPE